MLWVPQKGIVRVQHNTGAVGATVLGTAVNTHGSSASTKGTPAQMIASTNFDAYWVRIIATDFATAATAGEGCMDILVGAATEEVLIPDLLMGYCGQFTVAAYTLGKVWDFPLYIPAGSRLAVRSAGTQLNAETRVAIYLYGGHGVPPFRVGSKVTTYGMGTVPNGTAITPGASGAEGSWTQIVASTTEDHFALVPSFQPTGDTTTNNLAFAVDLGVGSATEEMVAESYWFSTDSSEGMSGPFNSMPCFQDIPSGTRLAMRASNSGANDGAYNAAIHAVS